MLNEKCKQVSLGKVNKQTTRNTRDANDFVYAKRLARKKPGTSEPTTSLPIA